MIDYICLDGDRQGVDHSIDAMIFIQKHKRSGRTTLDQLQLMYLDKIIYCQPIDCSLVCFAGDRYDVEPSVSSKPEESEKYSKK